MRISGSFTNLELYSGYAETPDASTGALVPVGSRALAPSRSPERPIQVESPSADGAAGVKPDANRQRQTDTVELQKQSQGDVALRQLERMRLATAGRYAHGDLNCEYRLGPDGRIYEVGSGVILDVSSAAGGPLSTVTRRKYVGRTALAPAQPSVQDYSVASRGTYEIYQTRRELISQERQRTQESINVIVPPKGTLIDIWV
jgi:hypothetical protein